MKIKIKDLEPNPFRDMESYPIEEARIQGLMNSIKETGFWDNIPVRKNGNGYQIPYGHHRLEALKRLGYEEIQAVVKDISDEDMIRIMANENDDLWGLNSKVDDETIKVAREFIKNKTNLQNKSIEKYSRTYAGTHHASRETMIIVGFLGENWGQKRVEKALERLKLYDEGVLSREAVYSLPTTGTSRSFVKSVKEIKPDLETQEKLAHAIRDKEIKRGYSDIHHEMLQEKLQKNGLIKKPKKKDKTKDFLEYIEDCNRLATSLSSKLIKLIDFKQEFDSDFYQKTFERYDFLASAKILIARLEKLMEVKDHERLND